MPNAAIRHITTPTTPIKQIFINAYIGVNQRVLRNLRSIIFILFNFLLFAPHAHAQQMPISVTTILTPPYTASLSDMAQSGSTRLMVNLLVNDVTVSELPVKLHIKMESAGITIESIPTQAVRPIFLGGGEAMVLTGDDFAQYLRLDNLNFKGFSKNAYQKNGQLPGGLWKISVSVRHFYNNKILSNIGAATAWITTYKPPVLTYPSDGEIAPSNAALPINLSWQASKHTGGTSALMYRVELWERRIEGVPAQAVAASVPPIYTTETAGLTASIVPAALALEPGMKYCWRVTAFDPAGMVTFENKGESEIRTFQYLEKCPEVCGLTIELKDNCGYASWEENRLHVGGYNFEAYNDDGSYHETLWGGSNKTVSIGCEYSQTWHVRVQGICRGQVESAWSEWEEFRTPDKFVAPKRPDGTSYECGAETPERVIINFELTDNIQKGDTLEDERGTTKYIVHSATRNDDGSFRGLSYMKLSFWGVKVLGEYNNMRVNTDGVIIGRYSWKSVSSGRNLVNPEDIEKWADELALEMASATYNNTIKDTIVLEYSKGIVPFETIRREGTKYYAVTSDSEEEITSFINGKTRVMIKDGDGHELVIDKDGNVMGVEEYLKCGGSAKLLSEHNAHRDSTMSTRANVTFSKIENENYGFDYWRSKDYDKDEYPTFNGYRPAYICAQKQSNIKVQANQTKGLRFITERGVPIIVNNADNTLTLNIGTTGKQAVYAYDADSALVGKLCVQAYDVKEVKVHLIRINNNKQLDVNKITENVNNIYAQALVHYTIDELDPITIDYANHKNFVHGGKGTFQNYNVDQKAAIKALPKTADQNDYYIFFVECYDRLDTAGNKSLEPVAGYMPVGRHYGFIYNEFTNARTIAHELCHGAFHLKHTFDATDYLASEGSTDNLMDYNGGTTLNHWQWKDIHQPKSVRFKWLQEEKDAEYNVNLVFDDDEENYIGSNAILNFLLSKKENVLSVVLEYNEQIDNRLAAEIITRFFYNEGIDVEIKNADEAYYYLLQIFVADLQNNASAIENVDFEIDKTTLIQEMQRYYRWLRNVALFHDDFISIARAYITVNKAIENVNDKELRSLLKDVLSSSNNIELKASVLGDMTNSQFKKILRQNGSFSNKEISELLKIKHTNAAELSKNAKVYDAILKSKASAFEPFIENANRLSLMKYAADCNPNIASEKYLKILDNLSKIGIYFDLACASQTIAEGKVAPKDLVALLPHLTGGAILIELMSERVWPEEENYTLLTTYKDIINDESGKFYLQYTNQLQKLNYHVVPTSFVFKNIEEIEGLFTITPQYVNYSNGEWSGQIKIGK